MSEQWDASQFATETGEGETPQSEPEKDPISDTYFLLIFRSNDDNDDPKGQQRRLDWLDDLRSSKTLLMSGPSRDRTHSICVVKAASVTEAQNLVRSDPWHDRWRSVDVIEWEIHFGLPGNRFGS